MQRKVKRIHLATRPGTKTKQKKRRNKENRTSKPIERLVDLKHGIFPLPCSAYFAPLKLYLSILESSSHELRARPTWLTRFPRSRIASLFLAKFRSVHMKSRVGRFFATEISVTRLNSFP